MKDYTDKKFHKLTFVAPAHKDENRNWLWKVVCECGNTKKVRPRSVTAGITKSCGCLSKEAAKENIKDITGHTFGYLTVVDFSHTTRHGALWNCKCKCGNKKTIYGSSIRTGHSKSCGCLQKEKARVSQQRLARLAETHGITKTRLGKAFANKYYQASARCNDKKNPNYGGRGIKFMWNDIISFQQDMYSSFLEACDKTDYKNVTLERIDVDGNYCKDNCTWATPKEQARNRRNNATYTYQGETKCIAEWAELYNLSYTCLWQRLSSGKPIEEALTSPSSGSSV